VLFHGAEVVFLRFHLSEISMTLEPKEQRAYGGSLGSSSLAAAFFFNYLFTVDRYLKDRFFVFEF
jgi:hypothetical protein